MPFLLSFIVFFLFFKFSDSFHGGILSYLLKDLDQLDQLLL